MTPNVTTLSKVTTLSCNYSKVTPNACTALSARDGEFYDRPVNSNFHELIGRPLVIKLNNWASKVIFLFLFSSLSTSKQRIQTCVDRKFSFLTPIGQKHGNNETSRFRPSSRYKFSAYRSSFSKVYALRSVGRKYFLMLCFNF